MRQRSKDGRARGSLKPIPPITKAKGYNGHEAHGTLGYSDADAVEVERAQGQRRRQTPGEVAEENTAVGIYFTAAHSSIASSKSHHGCKGGKAVTQTNDEEKEVAARSRDTAKRVSRMSS